jgi:GDP-4-dehydro-6-deoxy-D-mannose reductase
MMRAIVTGACGFVGRYLVRELDANGYEVLATDRSGEPPPYIIAEIEDAGGRVVPVDGVTEDLAIPSRVPYRGCDLLDAEAVSALVSRWRPRSIIHLAAQSSAGLSFSDPRGTLETNIIGTLNLLEATRRIESGGRPIRLLSVCSSDEYGRRGSDEMPLDERSPVEPASPYAVSKAAQGMLSLQYGDSYGIDVVVTRSFSHTGPGQTDRFVFPAFARQCAAIKAGFAEPVIRVGNLDVVRDFLDVRDVVRAYRILIEKGKRGSIYNVCSGTGVSLRDALEEMLRTAGPEIEVRTDTDLLRPVDVPVMIGDGSKLRRDTGWAAAVPFDRTLTDLITYWEDRLAATRV